MIAFERKKSEAFCTVSKNRARQNLPSSNLIMTYTSIAKPLTHYVDNPHAQALCQKYGLRLERIPHHDKFAILQLIGAIGSAYTDPRMTYALLTSFLT